jgi:murein DD-endopeptidase MepM/ murein hydrolase activator NlpD
MKKYLLALFVGIVLAGCESQAPAPVVLGYDGDEVWEPARPEQLPPVVTPAMDAQALADGAPGQEETAQPRLKTYMVRAGDTLHSLAKRFQTSVGQLMAANNIKVPKSLQEGQVLAVPLEKVGYEPVQTVATRYSLTRGTDVSVEAPPQRVPLSRLGSSPTAAVENVGEIEPAAGPVKEQTVRVRPPAVSYVTHRVKPGETLYRIGLKYEASPFDIMAANDLDRPQDLRAETLIQVPVQKVVPREVRRLNRQVVQAKGMVWPAQGQIIRRFGHKGDGVTHTGINIKLAENTPVLAAEGGTVIYADDGLKSYGNLVLLRHDDGLVTAYAHNNRLEVRKNQRVQKGEIIALSGATGNVSSPQLHFEVRRNAQALDPLTILPK